MFDAIQLGNFKAFGPTQRIPIKPITLVFGPNSAGKSSILHSLLMANEAQTNDDPKALDVRRTHLGGDSVDLGGFRQFVHQRNIASRVEWGLDLNRSELEGRVSELLSSVSNVGVRVSVSWSAKKLRKSMFTCSIPS